MQRLKRLRLEKGVSQKDVAEYLNVSQQTVSRYETSDNLSLSQDILLQLSDYYHVSVDYLLSGKKDFNNDPVDEGEAVYGDKDPMEKELQAVFRSLSSYNKETLVLMGKRLLGTQKE